MVTGFLVDFHFWVAVVCDAIDEGRNTREHVVADLLKLTSLNEVEAVEVIDEMVKAGKLTECGNALAHTFE